MASPVTVQGSTQTVTVAVANAAVKAMKSTPIAILPAPGSGKAYSIIGFTLEHKFVTPQFSVGGVMAFYYGTDSSGVLASATTVANFLNSASASQMISGAGALAVSASTAIANAPIVFTNPTADFTSGNGSMVISVTYRVVTGL